MAEDSTTPTTLTGGSVLDKVAGKVKQVAGDVIGDEALAGEGRLQTAKADTADDAVELAKQAEIRDTQAELTAREQEIATERAEMAAQKQKEQEDATAEAAAQREAARLEKESSARRSSVERTRKQRETAADRELFAAAQQRATAEAQAESLDSESRRTLATPTPTPVATAGIRGLPGRVIGGYLDLLRLPVATAQRLFASGTPAASWAPTRFATTADAAVRRRLGSLLGDRTLETTADAELAELDKATRAAELSGAATQTRREADRELRATKASVEQDKQKAAAAASEQEQKLQREVVEGKQKVESSKAQAKRRNDEANKEREQRLKETERARTQVALSEEAAALAAKRDAVGKQEQVIRLDDAVDTVKASRTSK